MEGNILAAQPPSERARLCIDEIRQVRIGRLTITRDGKEEFAYDFTPSVRGVPMAFFQMNEIAWERGDESDLPRAVRNHVQEMRAKGVRVDVDTSTGGILCMRLRLGEQRQTLWYNAWTHETVVVADGIAIMANPRQPRGGES